MEAVILAAGKSTRMYPLTVEKHKTMLRIANKPILEYNLEQLEGLVDKAIIIVGHGKKYITDYFSKEYKGIKIEYVEQEFQFGEWHALYLARHLARDRFIVMMGDDLYSKEDIKSCSEKEWAVLASKKAKNKNELGMILAHDGKLMHLLEKDHINRNNVMIDENTLVNCGLYVMDKRAFEHNLGISIRAQFELADLIEQISKKDEIDVVESKEFWMPLNYPWNLLDANEFLLKKLNYKIEGIVELGVKIRGLEVAIGKGTEIEDGAHIYSPVIIGENCKIGPKAKIRGCTSIGDNCAIDCEIKNSIIGNNTCILHQSIFVGDSIIGDKCNIAAGVITGNTRTADDGKNIRSKVYKKNPNGELIGELVDTGRQKFGTVIGDNVKTTTGMQIAPGRKIWPGIYFLKQGYVVEKDIISQDQLIDKKTI